VLLASFQTPCSPANWTCPPLCTASCGVPFNGPFTLSSISGLPHKADLALPHSCPWPWGPKLGVNRNAEDDFPISKTNRRHWVLKSLICSCHFILGLEMKLRVSSQAWRATKGCEASACVTVGWGHRVAQGWDLSSARAPFGETCPHAH
jgi:hypothetical protein